VINSTKRAGAGRGAGKPAPLVVALFAAAAVAAPGPSAPIPPAPRELSQRLTLTTGELRTAIARWKPKTQPPPKDVVLYALYQQRIYRVLAGRDGLARRTLPRLRLDLRRVARDLIDAHRELYRLTPPIAAPTIKVGPARPAPVLLAYYRECERRFKVPWNVLAAVNFVESKFGRAAERERGGRAGADAVSSGDLAAVRARRERA
jgi:hypothetical protein